MWGPPDVGVTEPQPGPRDGPTASGGREDLGGDRRAPGSATALRAVGSWLSAGPRSEARGEQQPLRLSTLVCSGGGSFK